MEDTGYQHVRRTEDDLLALLVDTIQRITAIRRSRDGKGETGQELTVSVGGREEVADREVKQKVVGVMREMSVCHLERVTTWREALRAAACMFGLPPPDGNDEQCPPTTRDVTREHNSESKVGFCADPFGNTLQSVADDIEDIMDRLNTIITKLGAEVITLCASEASTVDADTSPNTKQGEMLVLQGDPVHSPGGCDCGHTQGADDGDTIKHTKPTDTRVSVETERTSTSISGGPDCSDVGVKGQKTNTRDTRRTSPETLTDFAKETEKGKQLEDDEVKDEKNSEWITVGLTGQQKEGRFDIHGVCFVTAPAATVKVMTCEVADALSSMVVTGSEELVSRVIRIKVQDGTRLQFPVTVIVPFLARYRGNYRDVVVKVVDRERRVNYITPVSTEGTYGGQRGSFAEVRVYSLGIFAVVSCLRAENYTVPRNGLSLKLPMDPRVCLDYLPGSFTAPVVARAVIQPVDANLLTALKSRNDAYQLVVSTSPLLYLIHPCSQPLRRPLTLTLPCPPDPVKRNARRVDESEHSTNRPISAAQQWDQPALHRASASIKPAGEKSNELLVLLGYRDKQWGILEKVTVRNLQNGLVSFELTENFERLLAVRLHTSVQSCHLLSLAEELEGSVGRHTAAVVLLHQREERHTVLVAILPGRELSWELTKLRARGYSGAPGPQPEISMCEGDQLLLCFSGNITSTGTQNNQNGIPCECITFHSQWKNRLLLNLTEVDPFGNHSSPHYKGTAIFYKVYRSQLAWQGDETISPNVKLLGDPVCKISLTLPKKVRTVNQPIGTKVKLFEETGFLSDSLLLWLAGELSEEEVPLLALSLHLRRSSTQLVKLRAGDSPSAQAFQLLVLWRRGQPAGPHPAKASQLARGLAKSGRPDLAQALLQRHAAAAKGSAQE
ncbi:death domain-containing protein 1 [Lampris incognitus]|uniref:death domain-containing protein 1 n=1 Tax=Lampris incognitus TaxID=2546036 RepID=UPI0024B5483D|nr:death domain-containing protein 1 [Lampris incognitus]